MIVKKENAKNVKEFQEVESGDVVQILEDKYVGLFFIKTDKGQIVDLESGEIFYDGNVVKNTLCIVFPNAEMVLR